jgi:hypothetical protein
MQRFDPNAIVRPTPEAKGYLELLKNNGAFSRMIDAYVFAASYAMKHHLEILPLPPGRQELVSLSLIDEDIRLALEASIHIICQHCGESPPADGREILDILTQYAEAGIKVLKQRWKGKVGIQIQDDIRRIVSSISN